MKWVKLTNPDDGTTFWLNMTRIDVLNPMGGYTEVCRCDEGQWFRKTKEAPEQILAMLEDANVSRGDIGPDRALRCEVCKGYFNLNSTAQCHLKTSGYQYTHLECMPKDKAKSIWYPLGLIPKHGAELMYEMQSGNLYIETFGGRHLDGAVRFAYLGDIKAMP